MKSYQLFWLILAFPILSWAEPTANPRETYVLRANDVVKLSVYEESDLSSEVTILKTGQASFPLIGSVKVMGLSMTEATERIRTLYAQDYLKNPQITLTVAEYATDFVSVIGQVKQPGKVPIPQVGNFDVGSALASAGGITDTADLKNIQLVSASGATRTLTYDAIRGKAGRIPLKSGDKLIVNESPFARSVVAVIGEVQKPGDYPIPRSGKFDLVSALATAGGLAPLADVAGIKVIFASGATSTYSIQAIQNGVSGKLALKGGDRVVVSKSRFANTTVTLLGQVSRPGAIAFPLDGRLDLMTAIAMSGGFTELANQKKVSLTRNGRKQVYDIRKLAKQGGGTIWLIPNDIVSVGERIF